ncbi:hypothetical protein H7H69_12930, partial [Mycobacterium heckeshornense]|nr:hypothetical protein [Mycobacterium heckeshornense]
RPSTLPDAATPTPLWPAKSTESRTTKPDSRTGWTQYRGLATRRTGSTAARLFYAYAETLLALDRSDEALQWFLRSAAADVDGVTDAEERVSELA